jgi:hypothetical protein
VAQPLNYFAWGTLLDQRTMREVAGDWDRLVTARLPGHRLRFSVPNARWRGATGDPVASPGESVYGVIYRILSPQRLDILAAHPGYARKDVTVETIDGPAPAVTLAAASPEPSLRPSEEYLRAIEEGQRQHGFDPAIREALRRWAAEPL